MFLKWVWCKHSRSGGEYPPDDYSISPIKEEVFAKDVAYLLHENAFEIAQFSGLNST